MHKGQVKNTRKWRRRNRAYINEVKGQSSCEVCGESRTVCLDFHHREPEAKKFSVAEGVNCSVAVLDKEIKKCMVVCSNCHRVLHSQERLDIIVRSKENETFPLFDL